jgi:hypothetical protein
VRARSPVLGEFPARALELAPFAPGQPVDSDDLLDAIESPQMPPYLASIRRRLFRRTPSAPIHASRNPNGPLW